MSADQSISKNHLLNGFILVVILFGLLLVYPFLYNQSDVLKAHTKNIDFYDIFKVNAPILNPQIEENRIRNELAFLISFENEKDKKKILDSIHAILNYTGIEHLNHFYAALSETQKNQKKTRIAHFGDSMIEGDLISMTLRDTLQKRFGGFGVGFVPITSITAQFRSTVRHSFSDGWNYSSLVVGNKEGFPLGISGEYFSADSGIQELSVSYASRGIYPNITSFPNTYLFYGSNDSIDHTTNNIVFNDVDYELKNEGLLHRLSLSTSPLNKVDIDFSLTHNIPVYGVSFESSQGILIDNFASRGNSGIPLTSIRSAMLNQFNQYMDYRLIILQFGMNVLSSRTNYDWYKSSIIRVVRHFQAAFPNASILLVGVADKSSSIEGTMKTDPAIPALLASQREAAIETEIAFFSLYNAMGGENSMISWVEEEDPPLANKDYTHFNFKGAKKASYYMYDFLMNGYDSYKENEENGSN